MHERPSSRSGPSLAVIGVAVVGLCVPASTTPGELIDISGTWQRNEKRSDDPDAIMDAALEKAGRRRPRGTPAGPLIGVRGRIASGYSEGLSASQTLTIEVDRGEVRIDSSGDRLRILRPDGRKRERRGSDGALVELRCEWKDGSLVVESKSERGLKVRETYTPAQGGRELAVSRRIEGGPFRNTIMIRSRYDPVDAEAAP